MSFSSADYDLFDEKAKSAASRILNKILEPCQIMSMDKLYPDDEDSKYAADLAILKEDKHVYNVEVEIKRKWENSEFPDHEVKIFLRKIQKWKTKLYSKGKPTHWMMFSNCLSKFVYVSANNMNKAISEDQIIEMKILRNNIVKKHSFLIIDKKYCYFGDSSDVHS